MSRIAFLTLLVLASAELHAASLDAAIAGAKPILDLRLRYEHVDQPVAPPRTESTADAITARLRAGFETGKAWHTALLVEGEFVGAWLQHYNSTANGRTGRPVVADPAVGELNRLQLTSTAIPHTTLTLGRQRINLDDQRFVGNVGWRQNEQTYDAVRVVNTAFDAVTFDVSYAHRVHRVFGDDSLSQLPRFTGDVVLANITWQLPLARVTAFGYTLDLSNSDLNSSTTLGLRAAGSKQSGKLKWNYAAAWATQADHAANPVDYHATYWLGELGATVAGFTGAVGLESLGSDGARAFATPLATLHKFQGWADVFVATPADGLHDRYASLAWSTKRGPLDAVNATAVYHDYQSDRGSADLGKELNLLLSARIARYSAALKYADYQGPLDAQDLSKFWFELSAAW